ncbi:MAG: diacylglycerol kinase family protein [Pirellulales bacterium]|nr:diacylglycerol kinase family protein [Pirellulales bacterium]
MSTPPPPADDDEPVRPVRTWVQMFRDALRGVKVAIRGEVNFFVHLFIAVMAAVAGAIVELSDERWCLYILCVTIVLSAEMFNTAIEHLARAVTRERHPEVRDALDIASGAVLVAALGASFVGVLIIAWPFIAKLT